MCSKSVNIFFLCLLILFSMSGLKSMKSRKKDYPPCPGMPNCECKPVSKAVEIKCWDVGDLAGIRELLKNNTILKTKIKLTLDDCSVRFLPSDVIANANVTHFVSNCPLENIEENAFIYARDLQWVFIFNSSFTTIPVGLLSIHRAEFLNLIGGSLRKLGTELRNFKKLRHLSLRDNAIETISGEAFRQARFIDSLDLSQNPLTFIPNGTLHPLSKLQKIILAQNNLLTLDNAFKNFKLKFVDVSNNKLTTISDAFAVESHSIQSLNLSGNPLNPDDLFLLGKKLKSNITLDISECNLTRLDGRALQQFSLKTLYAHSNMFVDIPTTGFHYSSALQAVDFSNNRIRTVGSIFVGHAQIRRLSMDSNDISSIDVSFVNVSKLATLSLSNNKIQSLKKNTFSGTTRIRTLDLSSNCISRLDEDSLVELFILDTLDLSGNRFTSLNGSLMKLDKIRILNLADGWLEYIGDNDLQSLQNLHDLVLRGNRLRQVDGVFNGLLSLKYLDLAGNNLRTLSRDSFPENMKIIKLWLADGNEWHCDCRHLWILDWMQTAKGGQPLKDDPVCHHPTSLSGLPFRNLTFSDLTKFSDYCPETCDCQCLSEEWNHAVEVDCSNRSLVTMSDMFPAQTGVLKMNNNSIAEVNFGNLTHLHKMRELDLSNNDIEYIGGQLPQELNVLKLNGNKLKRMPDVLTNAGQMGLLSLSGNPWICDCDTTNFRKFLATSAEKIDDVDDIRCYEDSQNGLLVDRVIVSLSDEDLCPRDTSKSSKGPTIGAISALAFIAAACGFSYNRHRLIINAWLYSRGVTFVKRDEDEVNGKVFDAALLYAPQDYEFAKQTIAAGLEPQYKIYLPERNVAVVTDINANMKAVLNQSRRLVVIFSKAILNDKFSMDILRYAHGIIQKEKAHGILVTDRNDGPSDENIDQSLKEVIDSCSILRWNEKMFWPKLRYLMPKI